jgi:hypothetical protein
VPLTGRGLLDVLAAFVQSAGDGNPCHSAPDGTLQAVLLTPPCNIATCNQALMPRSAHRRSCVTLEHAIITF